MSTDSTSGVRSTVRRGKSCNRAASSLAMGEVDVDPHHSCAKDEKRITHIVYLHCGVFEASKRRRGYRRIVGDGSVYVAAEKR